MVRIDMSEYSEKHSVARLVGAPPGYVGYDQGGQLTEAVRRRPYTVVLLDEVEKAHPDVFDMLLQVLDDGRLTDGQGRTVDFRNTILVLTSNLGCQVIADHDAGRPRPPRRGDGRGAVALQAGVPQPARRRRGLPRALDRGAGPASSTSSSACWRGGWRRRRLTLDVTEAAREWLAMNGFDPVYGARPLRRLVQSSIGDQLAKELLAGEIREGDTVRVDLDPTAEGGTGALRRRPRPPGGRPVTVRRSVGDSTSPARTARRCAFARVVRAQAAIPCGRCRLAATRRGTGDVALRGSTGGIGSTLRAVGIPSSVWFLVAVVALVVGAALLIADRSHSRGGGRDRRRWAAQHDWEFVETDPVLPGRWRFGTIHQGGPGGGAQPRRGLRCPPPTARARATCSTTSRPGG